jgi:hypothetical protein
LEELKQFIKDNTYRDYFRDKVVDPEKIIEIIKQFQAEQKVARDDKQ